MFAIRPATAADLEGVARLTRELAEEFLIPECTAEGAAELRKHFSLAGVHQRFEAGFRHHVALSGSDLAGVIVMRENRHLLHLFVAKPHQSRGLARALWNVARLACLDAGASGEFTVNSSRGARGVYEAFGFVPQHETIVNGVPFIPMTFSAAAIASPRR